MIDKFVSSEDPPGHREAYGGYNDTPPNWTEIDEREFSRSAFFTYSPEFSEYRQMRVGQNMPMLAARLYYMSDGSGFAMAQDYYAQRVRYFKFARCVHEYQGLSRAECRERNIYHGGRCYHVAVCKLCGFVKAVDSSD